MSNHLNYIAEAQRNLKATGTDGFEGLVGQLLGGFCSVSFRLASSGLQQGQDGQNFDELLKVSFEAKRYSNEISKDGVQSKVTEICAQIDGPDVWVLAATGPLNPTTRKTVELQLEKEGIAFLCMDWCEPPELPLWAVLCSHQSELFLGFEAINSLSQSEKDRLKKAMEVIRSHPRYENAVADLTKQLTAGSIGLDAATKRNQEWLKSKLSDKAQAKAEFGQILAPNAKAAVPTQSRDSLTSKIVEKAFNAFSENPIFLLGGEGHGKSWAFAQSYLSLDQSCLTLMLSTSNIAEQHLLSNVEDYLVQCLISQTGDSDNDKIKERWKRRFQAWKKIQEPSTPFMTIFVDGINQKPNLGWVRWIEKLTTFCRKIGANLVISSREHFAKRAIFPKLYISKNIINIPEWSDEELKEILTSLEVDYRDVETSVFNSLKNPRLLSVAFETLGKNRIRDLAELNPSRLLYEYVFAFGRENDDATTPQEHISSLSNYAGIVLGRLEADELDDLSVFSDVDKRKIQSDLDAVSSERFFEPLPTSPELFKLKDEGLDLAIGISIIKKLKKAERNNRDVHETLNALLDPFSALDRTSDILLGGCVAAVLDDHCPTSIRASLIGSFLNIQNLNENSYQAFQGLVRAAPKAALMALRTCYQNSHELAHKDWLLSAIKENVNIKDVSDAMSEYIHSALRTYTLDPKVSVLARRGDADRQEKLDRKTAEIKARLEAFTLNEKLFLDTSLTEVSNFDLHNSVLDCFYLLSGLPLAAYADSLFAWRFGVSINASFNVPTDEFAHLLSFNTIDWDETRDAILEAMKTFDVKDASDTARWALRGVLFSTGAEQDYDRSAEILNSIKRESYQGAGPWRLIEKYCDTDPCDPDADYPSNIQQTHEKFRDLDFSTIRSKMSSTAEDHFFTDAQTGLARFKGKEAFEAMQNYVRNVLGREESELKFGVFSLEKTPELLPSSLAKQASQRALDLAVGSKPREGDDWVKSQLLLNLSFCHFDGSQQLALIEQLDPSNPMLTSFENTFRQALSQDIEATIQRALDNGQRERVVNLLSFLRTGVETRGQGSVHLFRSLLAHENSVVRAFTLALLGDGLCDEVLAEFAKSTWTVTTPPEREETFETWYGSRALIIGADKGFLSYADAAVRISSPLFGSLTSRKDKQATYIVAQRLDQAIKKAIGLSNAGPLPRVEVEVLEGNEDSANYLSIAQDDDDENQSWEKLAERMNESAEDFQKRQLEANQAYQRFRDALTQSDARVLLDDIGRHTIRNIFDANPEMVVQWTEKLLSEHSSNLVGFKNISFYVAEVISTSQPAQAVELFARADTLRSFTNFTSGLTKSPLKLSCIWRAADSLEMKQYRADKLRLATNDDELAEIVLAGQLAGKTAELFEFIRSELQTGQPARQARAIAVTGFLDESEDADELLVSSSKRRGLLGRAYQSAKYAYERNIWARHWYGQLAGSNDQETFWRNGVLLSKIVDGRIDLWRDEYDFSEVAKKFNHGITKRAKVRIDKWAKSRKQKLFGEKIPNKIFIY